MKRVAMVALILASVQYTTASDAQSKAEICSLLIKNDSGSTVWITTTALPKELPAQKLEQADAIAIHPYEVGAVNVGKAFMVYTRAAQSNALYRHELTVIQRMCDPASDEYVIDFSLLKNNKADPARFIVIDQIKEKDIPESTYPLCPGGTFAELDDETSQWFCKVYRLSDAYGMYVDEYVPVLSYIYQWLPEDIIQQWYSKNPQFYHWYHAHPDFYSHLEQYKAPWQTGEYEAWYAKQPEQVRTLLKKPESIASLDAEKNVAGKTPIGLPEHKIKTSKTRKSAMLNQEQTAKQAPEIGLYSKPVKKQKLEDIVDVVKPAVKTPATEKKPQENPQEQAAIQKPLKPYDGESFRLRKKPVAIVRTGTVTTKAGKQKVVL